MSNLQEYTVTIGGIEHTMRLTPEEAKARGAVSSKAKAPAKKAAEPPNKARKSAPNKGQ